MPTDEKAKALAKVSAASKRADAAQAKAADAYAARNAAAYDAYQVGATYAEVAVALGVTKDRISQVLSQERAKRATA